MSGTFRTVVLFAGPTLAEAEGRRAVPQLADALWRPPVAQGDLYLAARERPWGIGVIDGYFDRTAAVWHKEILWALASGVHVFGASSLGALRAVECAPYGMEGVGEVYAAFLRGELEDDDEVTVVHAPAGSGYAAGSEAMVNLRSTLAAAAAAGVIGEATRAALEALAKALPYPERGWPIVLEQGERAGLPPAELSALSAWLPGGRVDRKKLDALALLARMAERRSEHPGPFVARFHLQRTEAWETARLEAETRAAPGLLGSPESVDASKSSDATDAEIAPFEAPLDELRLQGGEAYRSFRARALVRALALELADRRRLHLDASARSEAAALYRFRRDLATDETLAAHRAGQRLASGDLDRLACEEALVERILPVVEPGLSGAIRDELKASGDFEPLAARAEAKARALAARGLARPSLADAGRTEEELWAWYFTGRLGRSVPRDLPAAALELGFHNLAALRRAVLREMLYVEGGGEKDAKPAGC
ncbi:MAG TPA: TfuA-like protein [Thermoanaerobaculia bacterium]|nr:TfuA-like protein [Thermoanaerobaculia bacterium]